MSATKLQMSARPEPGLKVVQDAEGTTAGSVMRRLGLQGPDPEWTSKLLDEKRIAWLVDRWDSDERVLTFRDTDKAHAANDILPLVRFEGLSDLVAMEVMAMLTDEAHRGRTNKVSVTRKIVNEAHKGVYVSIRHLNPSSYGLGVAERLRVWQERFDVATADRDAEWDRDEVRLAVVKPGIEVAHGRLPLGKISQLWLRDMTMKLLRARCLQLEGKSLLKQANAMVELSSFLAARDDNGEHPRALTAATMQQFTEELTDTTPSPNWHKEMLQYVSSVFTHARALELSPARLRAGFTVKAHHYPVIPVDDRIEKAIPIATYRLFMGTDHLLGPTALNLLASFRASSFDGIVMMELERFMANFGRRLTEACKLTVDRVRFDERGGAAISYDNFKEKRSRVWLPVDATEAEHLKRHVARLRERFPDTPDQGLRLFPKDALGGTIPIDSSGASGTHRRWVRTLEEAIIVAKLHKATGIAVPDLVGVSCADLRNGRLTVNDAVHELDTATVSMLVDYRQNILDWEARRARNAKPKREPHAPARMSLFPDWPKRDQRGAAWAGLLMDRLAPLGDDWVDRAAGYPSPGLPGGQLGLERVHPDDLHIERLRHTYLQHTYNATRDLETVKELAGHKNIDTTYKSYVSTSEQLREAVEATGRYRRYLDGREPHYDIPLATRRVPFVPGECGNPQVNDLGISGCPKAGDCGDCDHYISDPSNLPEIRQQIASAVAAIATAKSEPDATIREAKVIVLEAQIKTWRRAKKMHEDLTSSLPENQREQLLLACEVVRDFRESVRQSSGATFGTSVAMIDLTGPEPVTKGVPTDGVS